MHPAPAAPVQAGEREFGLEQARQRALQAIATAGYQAHLRDLRGAWRCQLSTNDGAPVPDGVGLGKGEAAAARAGALFEALEHHRSRFDAHLPSGLVLRSRTALERGAMGADPAVTALGPGLAACLPYQALDGTEEVLEVPIALGQPAYLSPQAAPTRSAWGDTCDYTSAARYCTNSGTAIGSTRTEALVHALTETIERDALSLLLAATFLIPRRARLRLIDPASLPASLARRAERASTVAGRPVHLIDMTTDLAVPAFCAHASPRGGHTTQGYGASLNAEHAAGRALDELVQIHAVTTAANPPPPDRTPQARHPRLLAAGRADFGPLLATADPVDFTATTAPTTPAGHLAALTATLAAHGLRPYARILHTEPNGVCTAAVCVPGLDKFFAIATGNTVMPSPHGLVRARELADR
ncbi:YcaO-like family protein [Streptomyces anulatus]|uniref:YcaO-like family protein n=1 Tax=Streptomyces anulatus TaxID=1892 RepID=UPI0036FA3212